MIEAVGKRVVVTDMESGERNFGKIIVMNDDGKRWGIRARWCKVHTVGPEVSEIKPGEWILVEHGRWSYGFTDPSEPESDTEYWIVDYPKYVILAAPEKPESWNTGNY